MTRILLVISAVPLAVAGIAALLRPTPPIVKGDRLTAPTPATPVQVIQFVRDDLSFAQEAPPLPEPRPYHVDSPASPPVAEPARKIRRPAGLCARHNLRKVWVTSSRWRCRR